MGRDGDTPSPFLPIQRLQLFTATCFSNVAVMGSLDVRLSVCLSVRLSVRDVGDS